MDASRGRLGLTFCPGKCQLYAATGSWERDLGLDLDAIRDWGAAVLVTLVEDLELEELRVGRSRLEEEVAARGIEWLHLPIVDSGVPDATFERAWEGVGVWLRHLLRRGRGVVLHCKGGLGRTGMIASRLLAELGMGPEEAIARVRRSRPGAIETGEQEDHVRRTRAVSTLEYPARASGCLLGGALGDALGAGIEMASLAAIRGELGPRGATGFVPAYGQAAAITDDTQMTLFTAEGLIRARVRSETKGISHPPSVVWHAYHRWLVTQGDAVETVAALHFGRHGGEEWPSVWPDGWLVRERRLHAQRAPGNTCLSALRSGRMGTPIEPINDSKGCGGVMRAAPAGLFRLAAGDAFELGAKLAAITHGHPSGYLTAGCLAAMVARLVEGASIRDALATGRGLLPGRQGAAEVEAALEAARQAAAADETPTAERVERLGAGWVAEEALAIAVYCALVGERWAEEADDDGAVSGVRPGLLLAVNHSGDSDSTGAIAGNLLGARFGSEGLPQGLVERVELRDVVERVADDVAHEVLGLEPRADRWERYPGW